MNAHRTTPVLVRRGAVAIGLIVLLYMVAAAAGGAPSGFMLGFPVYCAACFGASLGLGWLASGAAPEFDRPAWRVAWLRSHLWLQSAWIGVGPVAVAMVIYSMVEKRLPHATEREVPGVYTISLSDVLPVLIAWLLYIGTVVFGIAMWVLRWRKVIKQMQLRGHAPTIAFLVAGAMMAIGVPAAILAIW
ncbi:MAG TPA: hypothetical protein VHC70_00915 [Phycisphaerales bacterium]|nr:hypothetical protein [Phycisphaerales bacterium]